MEKNRYKGSIAAKNLPRRGFVKSIASGSIGAAELFTADGNIAVGA